LTTSSDQQFKADAGKLQARLLFEGMPRGPQGDHRSPVVWSPKSMRLIHGRVSPDERYRDAKFRHLMDMMSGPYQDDESGLPHSFHEATNTLFLLEKELSRMTEEEFEETLKFHKPPQDHKK
jgi:hypothetical protein